MTDLTKITTPFGLLSPDEKETLTAHGGPYEVLQNWGWEDVDDPLWDGGCTYRVKPQPRKPRQWWVWVDSDGYPCSHFYASHKAVKYRAPTTVTGPLVLVRLIDWPENAPLPSWPEDKS